MGQMVLGVVGGIIGGVAGAYGSFGFGAVSGAEYGFVIGSAIGAVAFPPKVDGPSVAATLMQRSNYGATLPIGFGSFRVAGNVIWEGGLSSSTSGGGKGSPSVSTTSWYATFAVAICDCSNTGPIQKIQRIWMNGQLVFDISPAATADTVAASVAWAAAYMVVYTGTAAQGEDPTMQAALGVGNVSGYHYTAYTVFVNLPLAQFSNVIPVVNFEVIASFALVPLPSPVKIFETAITTPTYAVSGTQTGNGALWPIITAVSASGISVIDRCNYATSFGQLMGDGNSYNYDFGSGSYLSTAGENAYQQAWGARSQNSHGPAGGGISQSGYGAFGLADGNSVVFVPNGNATGFASDLSGGYCLVMSGYAADATVLAHDCLPVLNGVTNVPSGFYLKAVYPCGDGAHIMLITAGITGAAPFVWSVISVTGGPPVLVASGAMPSAYTPNLGPGSSDANDTSPNNASEYKGCLDVDLETFWQQYGTTANGANILQLVNGNTAVLLANIPSVFTNSALAGPGALFAFNGFAAFIRSNELSLWQVSTSGINLGQVCSSLAQIVGIDVGNIDVSSLALIPIRGCLIERQAALRDILTSLAPTFWFDMVESDQKLAFRQRTSAPQATITSADMVSAKAGESPLLITRVDDLALPYHVDVGYYNIGADYQVGSQYAERLTTQSTQRTSINAAATMTDQDAVNAAAVILWDAWAGRLQFEFSTGFKWGQVEPTDIVTLQNGSQSYLARIVEKSEQAPIIKWKAVGCAPVYNQNVSPGIIVPTSQVVGSVGPTTLMLLDLPPLRDQDGNTTIPQMYVVMYGADVNWPGGVLFKSLDGGATWIQQVTSTLASGVGVTTAALTDWTGGNVFDECSTVTVNILTPGGSLASASELAVLNGANLCLIGNELLQFKNATPLSGTTSRLTGLLRGRIDTEIAMTGHTIGETFVLLSFANGAEANLNIEDEGLSDIGVARDYKAVTVNQPLASATAQFLTSKGENLVCFYPWGLLAVNSPGTNDIVLSWWRRNRITWQWLNSVDVPMSEATEAYVVSIFNGPTVVRTFNVAGTGIDTASVTYTTAQQIADFGLPQIALTWGVQQVSAVTGPGNMAKVASTIEGVSESLTLNVSVGTTATLTARRVVPLTLTASAPTSASV